LAIKSILRCFELVFGLKRQIGALGVEDIVLYQYPRTLNCRYMSIPFKYLGMLVRGNPKRILFWKHIIDKVRNKLFKWKGRVLSFAERVCLIKWESI